MRLKLLVILSLVCFFIQGANAMEITSSAFVNEGKIPSKYTCDGEDISPPLQWRDVPTQAKSLVLICDDPDAPKGTWTHWILYNLPLTSKGLEENISNLPKNTKVGVNSSKDEKYDAPCPPTGEHRYFFTLYALDTTLDFNTPPTSQMIQQAIQGHVLDKAILMGKYKRNK